MVHTRDMPPLVYITSSIPKSLARIAWVNFLLEKRGFTCSVQSNGFGVQFFSGMMRKLEVIFCVVNPGRKLVFTAIIRRKDDIQKIRCCSKAMVCYTGVKRITCQLEELKLGTDGIKVIETSFTAAKTVNVKKKMNAYVCVL